MHALMRSSPLVGLLMFVLLLPGAVRAKTVEVGPTTTPDVGQAAPPFSLPSVHLETGPVILAAFRGRIVYVDFWSAWCAPCRRSMPEVNALREELPRADFEVISINVDVVTADARRVLEQIQVNHPVAIDPARQAAALYGVEALPAGFLIDREGIVRNVVWGQTAEDVAGLRRSVLDLLEGEAVRQ